MVQHVSHRCQASIDYRFASTRTTVRHEGVRGGRGPSAQPCCARDGGRPSAAAVQAEAANHLLLLHSRGVVVSELGNGRKVILSGMDVCPAKAGMFSGSQSHRGNNQKPRSLDSREERNRISEAYRQSLPREDRESSGCNASEREVASKVYSEGRAPIHRAEAARGGRKLIGATGPLRRGSSGGTMTRTC